MHLIGRWEKVRMLRGDQWGLPYLLDRKNAKISPYKHEEWWKSPSGLWLPTMRGGSFNGSRQAWNRVQIGIVPYNSAGGMLQTVGLNSNYVFQTSGNASGCRGWFARTGSITDLYFYLTTYTGVAADVNDLNWEVRTGDTGATVMNKPVSGAAVASGSLDPNAATGWLHISSVGASITAGTPYWLILGDANGTGTPRANTMVSWNGDSEHWPNEDAWTGMYSTGGFTTGTPVAGTALVVAVLDDGSVYGCPWESDDATASGTFERGLLIDSITADLKLWAIMSGIADSADPRYTGMKIYQGTTAPGGSTFATSSSPISKAASSGFPQGFMFPSFLTLTKLTQYRAVFTYSANATAPRALYIGASVTADLRKAMPGGGGWKYTKDTAGSWVDDSDRFPKMSLLVEDVIEPAGGSTMFGPIAGKGLMAR